MARSTARSRLLNVAVAVFTRTTLSTCLIQIGGSPSGLRFSGKGRRRIATSRHLSCRFPARLATGQPVGPDPMPSCRTSPARRGHAASPAVWAPRPGRRDSAVRYRTVLSSARGVQCRHHPNECCTRTPTSSMAPSTTPSPGRRSGSGACPSTCRGSSSTPTWAAGIADHLTLWDACYRSIQLLGGMSRFVRSTSAHITALVNPPGNRRLPSGSTRGTQPTRRRGSLRPRRGGPVGRDRSIPNPAATPAARRPNRRSRPETAAQPFLAEFSNPTGAAQSGSAHPIDPSLRPPVRRRSAASPGNDSP